MPQFDKYTFHRKGRHPNEPRVVMVYCAINGKRYTRDYQARQIARRMTLQRNDCFGPWVIDPQGPRMQYVVEGVFNEEI